MSTKKSKAVKNPSEESGKGFLIALITVIVLAVLGIAGMVMYSQTQKEASGGWTVASTKTPENLQAKFIENEDGGYISFTNDKSQPEKYLDLFSDPRCPVCRQLENEIGNDVEKAIDQGVEFKYHIMSFLDDGTKSDYSKMLNGAIFAAVENNEPEVAWKIYTSMWVNQSPERISPEELPTQESISQFAKRVGASDQTVNDIKDAKYNERVYEISRGNEVFLESVTGSVGTPTLFVNGEEVPNPFEKETWYDQIFE